MLESNITIREGESIHITAEGREGWVLVEFVPGDHPQIIVNLTDNEFTELDPQKWMVKKK